MREAAVSRCAGQVAEGANRAVTKYGPGEAQENGKRNGNGFVFRIRLARKESNG